MSDDIPLVDLARAHARVADAVRAGFERVIASTAFIGGAEVAAFEAELARAVGARCCAGVASGTDALELILRGLAIGPGDEVVLPANTFVATAMAVLRAGATPVLVDCDPAHLLIDPARVAERLTARTRAIIAVHLYGQVAPVEALLALARPRQIALVEDAAQAHGAARYGRNAGTLGAAAGWSFYPSKNLGAYGDAGAVTTDDLALDTRIRALRQYGEVTRYVHAAPGFNSRLDALQAVVLRAKLVHLAAGNEARRRAAARYDAMLAELAPVERPRTLTGNHHVYHLYVVQLPERDRVLAHLRAAGIGAAVHYPVPLHLQGALAALGHGPGDFPVAERAAARLLSLPLCPELDEARQDRVVAALARALGSA